MSDESCEHPESSELDRAIGEYLDASDGEKAATADALLAQFPRCAAELKAFFATFERVDRFLEGPADWEYAFPETPAEDATSRADVPSTTDESGASSESHRTGLRAFVKLLGRSRLISEGDAKQAYARFTRESPPQTRTAKRFALWLVGQALLTEYQARRLLSGRGEGFFLGGCKILDRIGAGGMGRVYRAEQLNLGRQVALKVLPAKLARKPDLVARFQREARAAAALKHPHIVQVFDVGEEGGVHYILMELVRGRNLAQWIKTDGPLDPFAALQIIRQLLSALAHAHRHHIIHRDVKPSNIVLEGDLVKLLDLGLARPMIDDDALTESGSALGTPDFMSPEQCRDARLADRRSDLYAVGCTWYALLAGNPPFHEGLGVAKVLDQLQKEPTPIQQLAPAVDSRHAKVIHRLLAKSPDERFGSAEDVLAALGGTAAPVSHVASANDAQVENDAQAERETVVPADDDSTRVVRRDPHAPSTVQTSVPSFVVMLIPVMAALVLGGGYLGIRELREHLGSVEPVVVHVDQVSDSPPTVPQESALQSDAQQSRVPDAAHEEDLEREPASALEPVQLDSSELASPEAAEPRESQAPLEGSVQLTAADADSWETAREAVTENARVKIDVASSEPLKSDPWIVADRRVTVEGGPQRSTLLLTVPDAPQHGDGLWRLVDASLQLSRLDVFVDLTERTGLDERIVLFEAHRSNVQLVDCTVTVLRGAAPGRSPVTAVRLVGERLPDPSRQGAPPQALQFESRNCLLRGLAWCAEIDSRHTEARFENTLAAGPGGLVNCIHSQSLEFEHQQVQIEISDSTLDLGGPIVGVEVQPPQTSPVPLHVVTQNDWFLSSSPDVDRPPQIDWRTPVDERTISAAVRWSGGHNVYSRRGPCLSARTLAGPDMTLVAAPDGWSAQGLGIDEDWFAFARVARIRGAWERRTPRDYRAPARPRAPGTSTERPLPGIDARLVPTPAPLP